MRIEFRMEGGIAYFPGLRKSLVIDSAKLPTEEAAELEKLVREARFFDLPAERGQPRPRGADYRRYTVTVDEGRRHHTLRLTDPIEDPNLEALVTYLQRKKMGGESTP